MTAEQIYCDLSDELVNQITSGEYEWDSIAVSMPIEGYNGYGVVIWCDEDESGRYFTVSVRENYTPDEWGNEVIDESTDTDNTYDLEQMVYFVLNKFYNKQYVTQ